MEVTETDNKADQLNQDNSSSVTTGGNMEVAETENESNQLSIDDPSADEHLGLINQQEYEAQFFGFTPKSFSDGRKWFTDSAADFFHILILIAYFLFISYFTADNFEALLCK